MEGLGWIVHLSFTWHQLGQLRLTVYFQDGFFIDTSGALCALASPALHMVHYLVPLHVLCTSQDMADSNYLGFLHGLQLPPEQIFLE